MYPHTSSRWLILLIVISASALVVGGLFAWKDQQGATVPRGDLSQTPMMNIFTDALRGGAADQVSFAIYEEGESWYYELSLGAQHFRNVIDGATDLSPSKQPIIAVEQGSRISSVSYNTASELTFDVVAPDGTTTTYHYRLDTNRLTKTS
jgi:hypothetical protein